MEAIQSHHLMKRTINSNMSQQQDCVRSAASPKPNQVGTVLLYGIPIVSLYIESQERLCLAQISNTLLKQFSYNEIHNRRVALGITCVQCTPVQLEILRRAGAMPVSSRRCGMITRREAERLCKSFLGDNAPPRLPEDFAFSVHHECAWGCRGSFLPSRYNSSRAKCIKCSYCGLFFSPNKFIFHSHRIGPSDKYVQPDAANFNSWRRHMKLSGDPPEEIIHAWEDVKAMFNGGTRKRLMTSPNNSSHSQNEPSPSKRIKDTPQINQPLIHAATAVAVASATANTVNSTSQFPIRPINIHHPASITATNSSQRISNLNPELQLPFSRTFMMDYMWHTQNKSNPFQFPNYALPWIKRSGSLLFGQQHTLNESPNNGLDETSSSNSTPGFIHASHVHSSSSNTLNGSDSKTLPSFYNNSAFKPVINNHQGRNSFAVSVAAAAAVVIPPQTSAATTPSNHDEQRTPSPTNHNSNLGEPQQTAFKEPPSSDDDEMVDIETTEDEHPEISLKASAVASQCFKFRATNEPQPSVGINVKIPPSSPVIEIENSTEIVWDGFLKKEDQSGRNVTKLGVEGRVNRSGSGKSTQILGVTATTSSTAPIIPSHPSPTPSTASSIESNDQQSPPHSAALLSVSSSSSPSSSYSSTGHCYNNNIVIDSIHYQTMKKPSINTSSNVMAIAVSPSPLDNTASRIITDRRSPSPTLLPPPPRTIIPTHPLSSPSTRSSLSPPPPLPLRPSPSIPVSTSSSAAVVAAAAAAAVAIAAFNNTHNHHHHHSPNMSNSDCITSSPSISSQILNIPTSNQHFSVTSTANNFPNANSVTNANNGSSNNNSDLLHSSQNYNIQTSHYNNSSSNSLRNGNNKNNNENCITSNSNSNNNDSGSPNNNNINAISNNNNNMNISNINNKHLNNNDNNTNSVTSINNSNNNNNSSSGNNEFWSVARLSFEPPNDYHHHHHHHRLPPFYRHDITRHFQAFRHGETTQTNGIG